MKRAPLARKTPLKPTPFRPHRSARAKAKDFSPVTREAVYARARGICEICRQRPIAHLHHAVYRSQQGTADLSNALGVCIACHHAVHATRAMREYAVMLAQELGGVT